MSLYSSRAGGIRWSIGGAKLSGERARLLNSEHALRMNGTSLWKVEGKRRPWVVHYSEYFGNFSEVRVCRCARWKKYDDKMWSKIRKVLIRGNRAASP